MYYFLGISILFASLLALNVFVSLAASLVWRVFEKYTREWTARRRKQMIFALRIFPLIAALVLVLAFLLPAYLLFEPHAPDEIVSPQLFFPALLCLIGIAVAAFRVFGTWWRTRRLIKSWLARSEKIRLENINVPVYRIRHPFPIIAVVGTFKTKMFLAEQIFDALDDNELAAAIAHECGHLAARDNLKRTLMRLCRDLLVFPMGKRLERVWAENAEIAADEFAAREGGNPVAINLASALVKIARIIPPNTAPAMPLGAFLIAENNADVTRRVRLLINIAENFTIFRQTSAFNFSLVYQFSLVAVCAVVVILATNQTFLLQIHNILESFVRLMQ